MRDACGSSALFDRTESASALARIANRPQARKKAVMRRIGALRGLSANRLGAGRASTVAEAAARIGERGADFEAEIVHRGFLDDIDFLAGGLAFGFGQ